jgi:hypothetical protein
MTTEGKLLVWGIVLVALIGGGWYFVHKDAQDFMVVEQTSTTTASRTFLIDGTEITLINGAAETQVAPGSASKAITNYFGNEIKGDFNADGVEDSAFLVTHSTGGSGTFFYLATSLGGNAHILGDRIAPQTTTYTNGKIIVNYADRKAGEPMTATPTVGISRYFVISSGELTEVLNNAPSENSAAVSKEKACTSKGGTWSQEYRECAGVDGATCTSIGGTYNECASACRHNPKAEACIMMCVQVCQL